MPEHLESSPEESSSQTTDFAALYREAHPNAVEDVAKAEAMAHAGDHWESDAAAHRAKAEAHREAAIDAPDTAPTELFDGKESQYHTEAAEDHSLLAESAAGFADDDEHEAGEAFDHSKEN